MSNKKFLTTIVEFLTGKDFERRDLPRNEIAVLKVINFVFVFLSATTFAIFVMELIWHTGASESVNGPTDIVYFFVPFALRTRYAHFAKIVALIVVDINLVYLCCIFGPGSLFEMFFISTISSSFMVFSRKQAYMRWFTVIISVFCVVLLNYFDYNLFPRLEMDPELRSIMRWISFTSSLVATWFMFSTYSRIKEDMEEQTMQLLHETKDENISLSQSSSLLREIFDRSPFSIFITAVDDGRLLFANARTIEQFELPNQEAVVFDYYANPNEQQIIIQTLQRSGKLNYLELELKTHTGKKFWAAASINPIEFEGVHGVLTALTDITGKKGTEMELSKSRKLFEAVYNESMDAIFIEDTENGVIVDCNDKAVELFGAEHKVDLVHLTVNKLNQMVFLDPSLWELFNPERRVRPSSIETRFRALNGRIFWGSLSNKFISVGGKTILLTKITDISRQKEAEQVLIDARKKAEQASDAKAQFLSIMSHEIRTPLNGVIGLTSLLLHDDPKPEQLENLQSLQHSADHLLGLINNILNFSKIEAGKIEFEHQPFKLNTEIESITNILRAEAQQKALRLEMELPAENIELNGDALRLKQVLGNLVNNAIKFTETGFVKVKVTYEYIDLPMVMVYVTVNDSGIGIPQHRIDLIFDAFSQGGSEITRRFGGTGLGLAITRRLIELQGGKISVQSEPGLGSTFKFQIAYQLYQRAGTGRTMPQQPPALTTSQFKVLLVEDNTINLMIVEKLMKRWGIAYDSASNGKTAVELVQQQHYNLVFMDLHMPEMDGLEATRLIRTMDDDYFRNLPIYALTADAFVEVKEKVMANGFTGYISKPFRNEDLLEVIRKHSLREERV